MDSAFSNFEISNKINTPLPTVTPQNKGVTPSIPADKPDEFVKTTNSDNFHDNKKNILAAGAAAGIATLGTIAILIAKNRYSKAMQLAEHIEFKPAKTIQEAIEFGKKNLGIKKYSNFGEKDIEAINFLNEGFVNASNMMKGKIRLPKKVSYDETIGENALAGVITDGPFKGRFFLNKNIFTNIEKYIDELIAGNSNFISVTQDGKNFKYKYNHLFDGESIKPLIQQIAKYKSGKLTTLKDKALLYNYLGSFSDTIHSIMDSPFHNIKSIIETKGLKEICELNNIPTDLEKIKLLPLKEQQQILSNILKVSNKKITISFQMKDVSPFTTVYHELGHLQDMKPRCLTTDKFNNEYEYYPKELKEWVDNSEYMQIASRVSAYSTHGPGEFIAETFSKLMDGAKLPDEVISLYKKLEGPAVSGLV